MFDSSFVQSVASVLDSKCVGGAAVSRAAVCAEIGLDVSYQATISTLVKGGFLPGFEVRKGPNGGIGRAGEKAAAKPRDPAAPKAPAKAPEFAADWLARLNAALEASCTGDNCVTRDQLARALGEPGSKTEFQISLALKHGVVQGYGSQKGRNGGIRRLSTLTAEGATEEPTFEEPAATETAPEPVVETAPEVEPEAAPAPKKAKRSGKKSKKSDQPTA